MNEGIIRGLSEIYSRGGSISPLEGKLRVKNLKDEDKSWVRENIEDLKTTFSDEGISYLFRTALKSATDSNVLPEYIHVVLEDANDYYEGYDNGSAVRELVPLIKHLKGI